MLGILLQAGLLFSLVPQARAQDNDASSMRQQFAGMQRAGGEVTAVSGSTLTIKTEDGTTMQVTATDNTRIMKGRGRNGTAVKVTDLKVGDGLMAFGNLDAPNHTLHAAVIMATDAAALKELKDNLGKTYITGKVTAIDVDNATLTVERPDKVAQTIGFDETTSFKRGRPGRVGFNPTANAAAASAPADSGESITLADIKVGDVVGGQGALKAGVFVPKQLTVSTPGAPGEHRGNRTQPPAGTSPGTPQGPGTQ